MVFPLSIVLLKRTCGRLIAYPFQFAHSFRYANIFVSVLLAFYIYMLCFVSTQPFKVLAQTCVFCFLCSGLLRILINNFHEQVFSYLYQWSHTLARLFQLTSYYGDKSFTPRPSEWDTLLIDLKSHGCYWFNKFYMICIRSKSNEIHGKFCM